MWTQWAKNSNLPPWRRWEGSPFDNFSVRLEMLWLSAVTFWSILLDRESCGTQEKENTVQAERHILVCNYRDIHNYRDSLPYSGYRVHFYPFRLRLHCFFFQFEEVVLNLCSLRLCVRDPGAWFFDNWLIWQWQTDQELQRDSQFQYLIYGTLLPHPWTSTSGK